jgi:hypothetical protein
MYRWRIYEYLTLQGRSTIGDWLDMTGASERDRGRLVMKMDMLAMHGPNLPPGLLAGPIRSKRNKKVQSHIYKLIVHGDKMLRPFLCKGPLDMDGEFTMLLGAIEVNFKLDEDIEDAEKRRAEIIADPSRRRLNGRYR